MGESCSTTPLTQSNKSLAQALDPESPASVQERAEFLREKDREDPRRFARLEEIVKNLTNDRAAT